MKTSYNQKLFLFLILFLAAHLSISAQSDYTVISGVLKDAKSNDRVANAAITVPGTAIGTVSNADGGFILKIPQGAGTNGFLITHISYESKTLPIAPYTEGAKSILLTPLVLQLSEILVNYPTDAKGLVKKAFELVKNNFSQTPNQMKGFYRESIRQRRNYISIAEAVTDIYKAPYDEMMKDDEVRILKGRRGENVKKADTLNVLLQGGPKVMLWLDVAKNPASGVELINYDNYVFRHAGVTRIDDKPNYIVSFEPARTLDYALFLGKIFIRQDNYAITRVEFQVDLKDEDKAASLFITKKPTGLVFLPTETNYLVTYKEQNGKQYLNYIRFDVKFKSDWKRKLFKNNYTIISEMAITDRGEMDVAKIPFNERFRPNMIMSKAVNAFYDPQFWGEHNIIEPEEAIENAIRRILRKMN